MSLTIGPYILQSNLLLSPMAGITDRPYRDLCRRFGAGLTTSEMLTSDAGLQHTRKSQLRMIDREESAPRSVQIVGTEPQAMAEAARRNVANGAQIIDINMGCPAKKVCNKAAGSALMQDTRLVRQILEAVVSAVDVPVTLKTRTGWAEHSRNVLDIARIAEQSGIACLAIHGRTRNQAYTGYAEFETIRQIKQQIEIPVIANGDIRDVSTARFVLDYTRADGLMLGRITQGQPWIFEELRTSFNALKDSKSTPAKLPVRVKIDTAVSHIDAIHRFYGTDQGVRIARKHIGWYLSSLTGLDTQRVNLLKKSLFKLTSATGQLSQFRRVLNDKAYIIGSPDKGSQLSVSEIKTANHSHFPA